MKSFLLIIFVFSTFTAFADEEIRFSNEELPAESVLPVFDNPRAVRNRLVNLDSTLEVGIFAGALLNEAFFRQFSAGLTLSYHMDERHGFNLMYAQWLEGETTFKQQIESDPDLDVNLEGAPELENMAILYYQYTPWYGKISLTKETVANLHLYILAGAGVAGAGGEFGPAGSIGLGQKFYFSPRFAIRFDLRGVLFQAPDPLSVVIPDNGPVPETSEFEKKFFTNSIISAGLIFLL